MFKQAVLASLLFAGFAVSTTGAYAQDDPPAATRFEKVDPGRLPRRADEPRRAPRRARAAHDAHRRDPHPRPEDGPEHAGGGAGRLPARRGGPAERRGGPELRAQPLGLRLLLAAAEHARGQAGDAGAQRGRRAGVRHRRRLPEVQGRDPPLADEAQGRQDRPEDRAEDPRRAGRPRHVLPRRRQHRLRLRGQPLPLDRRRQQPVLLGRLRADRLLARTATRCSTPAAAPATRTTCAARSCGSGRGPPRRLHDPGRQPVP